MRQRHLTGVFGWYNGGNTEDKRRSNQQTSKTFLPNRPPKAGHGRYAEYHLINLNWPVGSRSCWLPGSAPGARGHQTGGRANRNVVGSVTINCPIFTIRTRHASVSRALRGDFFGARSNQLTRPASRPASPNGPGEGLRQGSSNHGCMMVMFGKIRQSSVSRQRVYVPYT